MATFGRIQEFIPESESFSTYVERLQLFFEANDVSDGKKVPVLLSVIGAKNYALLRSLSAPTLPREKSFDDIVQIFTQHFEPKPLIIAERFHFHRRNQHLGESVADYAAELRRLSTKCDFNDFLGEALRDRFVCGIRNESTQKRLIAEKDLSFAKAFEIAQSMEAAERDAKALKEPTAVIQQVSNPSKQSQCFHCGGKHHEAKNCRFREAVCHSCGKRGHIVRVCPAKKVASKRAHPRKLAPTRWISSDTAEESASSTEDLQVFNIGRRSAAPITVTVSVDDQQLLMEVDTGAAVSIIAEKTLKSLLPRATLKPTDVSLTTYTHERMTVLGELLVVVKYNQQVETLPLIVVAGEGPSLLGRNWLRRIRLDWKRIGTISCQTKTQQSLQCLLEQHSGLFKEELGTIHKFPARLQVRDLARPKFFKPRPVPFAIKGAIDLELDQLESSGILKKVSHSEWAAPIVVVPKKDGHLRICGDYKITVNQALDVEQYPLPKPEDLFASLSGGKKFTKLDLSQAYQQLILEEESQKYVTINTHKGLYQYTRLPYGVASAPAIFQRVMDSILQGIPHVICYIDDILVTGSDDEDHLSNLSQVLQRLHQHGVRMKKAKCEFLKSSVEYLGHCIDTEGLHTTNSKLKAVADAPVPRNVQELRSFLGLLNYYGKFIPNLSSILHPLNSLLQQGQRWRWTSECDKAFKSAKKALTSSGVLIHFNPSFPIKLAADASAYGVGAVIAHVQPDGSEKPIAFASRTLSASERNYAQVEKEALALIFGVKKFHQYLYGRKFTLVTDHKPLTTILGPKKGIPSLAAARLQRWAVLLSAYQYDIQFKPTKEHSNADGLSRLPLRNEKPTQHSKEVNVFNIGQIQALPVTFSHIEKATRTDPVLSKVLLYTKRGWPAQTADVMKPFRNRHQELTVEGGCVLWGIRVIVPKKLQPDILHELHRDHPGVTRMKSLARSYLWWPGLDRDLEELARSCLPCQAVKQAPAVAPLHPWLWPTKPWQRVHVDFAGPFKGRMLMVAVDAHSKWPEVCEMSSTTTANTVRALRQLFAAYGLPEQIVSDNGPQFISADFAEFMKMNGVKHIRCAPYHPSSNGAAERFVRTVKEALEATEMDGRTFQQRLQNFLLTYRSSPHATTGVPPCTLFLGRSLRTRLDLLRPDIEQKVHEKQAHQKTHHDQHAKPRQFTVGQPVMVRNLRPGPTWIPGTIAQQLGPVSYLVNVQHGVSWRRHVDHLKQRQEFPLPQHDQEKKKEDENATEDVFIPFSISEENPEAEIATHETTTQPATPTTNMTTSQATQRYPRRDRRPPDRFSFSVTSSSLAE